METSNSVAMNYDHAHEPVDCIAKFAFKQFQPKNFNFEKQHRFI
jgi:hypothetical protein